MASDHERIWLQHPEDADPDVGRQWCQDKVWPETHTDGEPTEYVRSDLTITPADLSAAEAAAAREAVEDCAAKFDRVAERSEISADRREMTRAARIVRALPPHPSGALGRMIAEAEKRGYKEGWNDREGDLLNGIDRVYGAEASRDE